MIKQRYTMTFAGTRYHFGRLDAEQMSTIRQLIQAVTFKPAQPIAERDRWVTIDGDAGPVLHLDRRAIIGVHLHEQLPTTSTPRDPFPSGWTVTAEYTTAEGTPARVQASIPIVPVNQAGGRRITEDLAIAFRAAAREAFNEMADGIEDVTLTVAWRRS